MPSSTEGSGNYDMETSSAAITALVRLADVLPFGVFVLDAGGRVILENGAARAILEVGDGLALKKQSLCTLRRSDEARLQGLIAEAQAPAPGVDVARVMALHRKSGRHPYGILVIPVGGSRPPPEGSSPAVALLVSDPERPFAGTADVLQILFGLTRSEASLALLLADGRTLQQAGAEQKIATRTARTHLRNVFRKTGARRQSELVRRICTSVAALTFLGDVGAAGHMAASSSLEHQVNAEVTAVEPASTRQPDYRVGSEINL
jgi:DNA-binding CsgD family transcriptional regulator